MRVHMIAKPFKIDDLYNASYIFVLSTLFACFKDFGRFPLDCLFPIGIPTIKHFTNVVRSKRNQ